MTFSAELAQMLSDVEATFGVTITLKKIVMGSLVHSTGARGETVTTQSISANRLPSPRATFGVGEASALGEERVFGVVLSSVTIGTPAVGWRVVDTDNTELAVIGVQYEADRLSVRLTCKKAG